MFEEFPIQREPGSERAVASNGGSSIIIRFLGALVATLGILLSMSQIAVAATTVDFFVYEGTQSGLTTGSTVTVSTGDNELALCINAPSGSAPNVTYTPLCNTAAAPGSGLSDGNLYTAVAFIGTYTDSSNEQINLFAVGDLNGNVYLMYPTVNSSGYPSTLVQYNQYTYNCGAVPCGRVTALAKDPNSNTLYVSFANINNDSVPSQFWKTYYAPQAALVVAPINSDNGSLLTPISVYLDYIWFDYGNTYGPGGNGAYDFVSPKLRVYPPNYPGLAGTTYYSTGAVFYSGIVGNGAGAPPVNKGYLCSGTECQISYAITLVGTGFSVMTAAEYGVDNRGGTAVPVLYWNQVAAGWYSPGKNSFPTIPKGTSNTVQSCQLTNPVNPSLTSSPCQAYVALTWPPANGLNVGPFVNEMVYLPTPIDPTTEPPVPYGDPSSVGVLMMSVWSPGYLVGHSVDGNEGTSLLLASNGSNGEVGANPVSLIPDLNSSVFMQAGAEGLIGFNIFAEYTNLGTSLNQFTYIDITSSSSGGSNIGQSALNGISVVGSVSSFIGVFLATSPVEPAASRPKMTANAPAGVQTYTLEGFLGSRPHRGRYTYDEATMRKAGVKPGQWIAGLRFALAEGISSRPKKSVQVQTFQLQLESGGKVGSRPSSSYPKTVVDRSLCIASESYDRTKGPGVRWAKRYGFGPVIWFDRPYQYRGGDLTMNVFGSGYDYADFPFYMEATTDSGVSGAYVTGPDALGVLPSDYPQVHAAPNVVFQKGRRSYNRSSWRCQ